MILKVGVKSEVIELFFLLMCLFILNALIFERNGE